MIVGLIVVGMALGGAAGVGALLFGFSILGAFLIYVGIGTTSVLMLAVSVALRPDPQDIHEIESSRSTFGPRAKQAADSVSAP
ncbi:hypothetical protein D6850_18365 [Roseovarius spongiae]|uniref:Uncharacterized protein n=1 Tax=Roseovarius spongiae TaxID=2320272 RepID=A0A3A8B3P8_9RHOB|nr:hypothetical protein [Roseovarius spongiae]RKF12434.1 hypothetical protein D6850_18365 [Roseovarius spongiae]